MKFYILNLFIYLITVLIITFGNCEKVRYDNYRIYSIAVKNNDDLKIINDIENYNGYQFWQSPAIGRNVEIIVPPHRVPEFEELVNILNLKFELVNENIQELIDNERPKVKPRVHDWTDYGTLDEIYGWLDGMMNIYPQLTSFDVGLSYQNRTIRGFKISYREGNPGIFIESNIHAREWITSATATWIINEFLTSEDPNVREIAENIDWYIVPVLNVDGFVYTHTTNRLWRKTRQNHATVCYGADPNRNFGFMWFSGGSSNNPCSENYAGPFAWSEPEAVALRDYYATIAESINLYISFHSSGQYLMFPYGHTTDEPPTFGIMKEIGDLMAEAIATRFGTPYTVGSSSVVLYATSGSSVDWAYDAYSIPVALIFELRDRGVYGHLLPADQIIPNSQEILDGFLVMVEESRNRGIL